MTLNNTSPTICLYISGDAWDHYLIFALTEINSGRYKSTLGDITFQHRFIYADHASRTVEGDAQLAFFENYESCHVLVGPAWTNQLAAIGELAGLVNMPIISQGATSPIFAADNFDYVSRSNPSDVYVLNAFVNLIVEYGLDLINVVYVNNDYGQSVITALIDMSQGKFEVQLLRKFDSVDDIEGINSVLDDLEDSPSHVTFLGLSSLETKDFLNIAGERGMHDEHLWLSPKAVQFADELNPASTGGIWGISYGEELTEESPLAQRYLSKDPKPHIEAMELGFQDNYDTLTYWGAYAYDAVLAAAHGLAAAANISDGKQVLEEIRGISLNTTNTGVFLMDEHGDRVGARIPIFFLTPEGTAEQFAVYNGTGDVILNKEPLWPGGSATQPTDLIQEDVDSNSVGAIVGGILAGLLFVVVTVFIVYRRRSKKVLKEQGDALVLTEGQLKMREDELQELRTTITKSIGSTKYGDAVEHVDTLINQENNQNEKERLRLIKRCLIRGNDDSMHIPQNLDEDEVYIMKEFAGMTRFPLRKSFETRHRHSGPSTANFRHITQVSLTSSLTDGSLTHCLPEFTKLDVSKQKKLFELLSFDNLERWDFNVFDVAEIDQDNTLLLVSWAVLYSPYSQIAMAKELTQVGVEVDQDIDELRGYDFTSLDFSVSHQKLINYLRLIQEGYEDNPYHNRIHAADVVQTLNSLLQMSGDKFPFEKEDLFLILVSAVVHDVKHPGRNNAFQVSSFSELALNWNDTSVLENEHVSYAFKCMIKEDESHFIKADPSTFGNIRKKIVEAVLHTDMSKHFAAVSKIKAVATGKTWDELGSTTRWEILSFILHMADISNPAKGDPMFKLWTDRCLDEFFQQGDKEREMGAAISPNCDRTTTKRPDSQIGFIKFVIKPAYEVLGGIIPAVKDNILPIIDSNLVYWEGQKCSGEITQ